ncbi:hypothetical protein KAJ27_08230 [bacterium]|nr:hypothetical protein [Candidatus Neomarinimicrobiota bacterium]MCK5684094.1 hypothetical protein [bacterium]
MNWDEITVFFIIIIAGIYTVHYIYVDLQNAKNGKCGSCPLAEACNSTVLSKKTTCLPTQADKNNFIDRRHNVFKNMKILG